MAYFNRNGFVPAREFNATKPTPIFHTANKHVPVSVKDVKYAKVNNERIAGDATANPHDLEKVMTYTKCLIRNLLQLSQYEHVERDTFLEFVAMWSQFIRWGVFQRLADGFNHYDLMFDLNDKLLELMKANKDSNLIELILSQRLKDQLEDSLREMSHLRNMRFSDIRF